MEAAGGFLAAIPAPLSMGTITLADGRTVKGVLMESQGLGGAADITLSGGVACLACGQ